MNLKNRIKKLEKKHLPAAGGVIIQKTNDQGFEFSGKIYPRLEEIPSPGGGGFLLVPEILTPEKWEMAARVIYQ